MGRTFTEWVRWRVGRIPRKLGFAKHRALWYYRDARNGMHRLWELCVRKQPIADVTRYERRIDSQNGEDGVLEAIFTAVGTTDKYFVEFGSGDLSECNTSYLARWKGWSGLWMDAKALDRRGRVKQELITAENVEAVFQKYRVPETFDLLSIDIDGNDYWVWKAITRYQPRVVVIEYNAGVAPIESRSIPYDPHYMWDGRTDYFGASLLALARLGEAKGYVLVGCESSGTNAFFVQRALVQGRFVLKDVPALYRPLIAFEGKGHPRDPIRMLVDV